jgi:PhoPQ-activated pathogenicity-related protein
MVRQWKQSVLPLFVVITVLHVPVQLHAYDPSSALDEFVQRPDPAFGYQLIARVPGLGFRAHLFSMTSQSWRSSSEVTPTLWRHWVTLIVPNNVQTTTAHLVIEGGDAGDAPPGADAIAKGAVIALATHAVLVVVQQVPMQPLQFSDEPAPIQGDALLAYSWHKVMVTGDPTWSALFPMTKAAVRAMDLAQAYVQQTRGWRIDDFLVTGASKRGAAAWFTAAVDGRVKALAPLVYPLLRLEEQIERHYGSYGRYSPALDDFAQRDIFSRLRSPEGELLAAVTDPLRYRERLLMPKYLVNGSGDEYFLPDATQRFFDALAGENLQRIVPDADHHLDGHEEEMLAGLIAWYRSVLLGLPRPEIDWRWNAESNTLEVSTSRFPLLVRLWQATNNTARDFRVETLGDQAWSDRVLIPDADGIYRARIAAPAEGYTAFLIELTYPGPGVLPQVYSTSVYITPDTLPFALGDPVLMPMRAAYWRYQVNAALAGVAHDYTPEQLQDLLPIRLFGEYLVSVADLEQIFNAPPNQSQAARRHCLAARLNVEADEIGWYSDVTLDDPGVEKFWRVYQRAELDFEQGFYPQAARLCEGLNTQPSAFAAAGQGSF